MTELLPCPFCGDSEENEADHPTEGDEWFQVFCGTCCSGGPYAATKALAVAGWNTRYVAGAKNLSSDSSASINGPKPGD